MHPSNAEACARLGDRNQLEARMESSIDIMPSPHGRGFCFIACLMNSRNKRKYHTVCIRVPRTPREDHIKKCAGCKIARRIEEIENV